jgi:hypothetical protein
VEKELSVKAGHGFIGINKITGAIQLTVPHGSKLTDVIKGLSRVDLSALAKLPRGCQACLSGHSFDIREQFDPVINVELGVGH